jgi:hypothetical protein
MAEGKNKIIVNRDWISTFESLNDEEAGKLIKHFFRYVNDKNPEAPDRLTALMFEPIKYTLEKDFIRYSLMNYETIVYVIVLENSQEKFVKIGISYDLAKRYSNYRLAGYNVLEIITESFPDKLSAEYRESILHEKYSSFKYIPKRKFIGYSECFSYELLKHINI